MHDESFTLETQSLLLIQLFGFLDKIVRHRNLLIPSILLGEVQVIIDILQVFVVLLELLHLHILDLHGTLSILDLSCGAVSVTHLILFNKYLIKFNYADFT